MFYKYKMTDKLLDKCFMTGFGTMCSYMSNYILLHNIDISYNTNFTSNWVYVTVLTTIGFILSSRYVSAKHY